MPPELHLQPDRLRSHAVALATLSEELHEVLHTPPAAPALAAGDPDRLRAAALRVVAELTELGFALTAGAAAAESADRGAASSFGALGEARP